MQKEPPAILRDWDDHMNERHGKAGTPTRKKWEQEFEAFKLGALLEEARTKLNPYTGRTCSALRNQ